MSRKPENQFVSSVHAYMPPIDVLYREKMHNPYRGGTWDWWYSSTNDLWVEYKFIVLPKRATTQIMPEKLLSELQVDWGKGRLKEGRNLAVIVGCKEGGVIFWGGTWLATLTASQFRERLVDRRTIATRLVYELTLT